MKRLILASLLFAAPSLAFAQQQQYQPLNETLLHQAEQCEAVATNQIAAMSKQVEADKKQIADLTKQVADAKAPKAAEAKPAAPVKADAKP